MSPLLLSMLGYGVVLPALVSAAVLLASGRLQRRAQRPASWPAALAFGLSCIAGQLGVEGGRSFPPREAADRLFALTLLAVALSLVNPRRFAPVWLRVPLCAVLGLAVVGILLPPVLRQEASRGELPSWLVGLGLAGMLFGAMLEFTAQRLSGAILPLVLVLVSVGTAGVLYRGHSITLMQLAGVQTAALLPILLRSLGRPPLLLDASPVVVLLPGLWLRSHFYAYDPPPALCFILLAAAALTGTLALLPGIRSLAPRWKCLLCATMAAGLAAGAVLLARNSTPALKPEEFLQINSRIGSAPSTTCTGRPFRSVTVAVRESMPRSYCSSSLPGRYGQKQNIFEEAKLSTQQAY